MRRPGFIGPDRFGALLVLLLVLFVLLPLAQDHRHGGLIIGVVVFAVFVVALSACDVGHNVIVIGSVLSGVGAVVVTAGSFTSDQDVDEWMTGLFAVFLAATTVLILRRILLHHRRVTAGTVAGVLCAYLLVGMTYASVYRTISGLDVDAFTEELGAAATYFSFVTLTTLGYGDITPVSDLARSLTTLEAVMGQVLLVTLVGRFVSTLGQTREPRSQRRGRDAAGADADG
jgi:hypothetical protein